MKTKNQNKRILHLPGTQWPMPTRGCRNSSGHSRFRRRLCRRICIRIDSCPGCCDCCAVVHRIVCIALLWFGRSRKKSMTHTILNSFAKRRTQFVYIRMNTIREYQQNVWCGVGNGKWFEFGKLRCVCYVSIKITCCPESRAVTLQYAECVCDRILLCGFGEKAVWALPVA